MDVLLDVVFAFFVLCVIVVCVMGLFSWGWVVSESEAVHSAMWKRRDGCREKNQRLE